MIFGVAVVPTKNSVSLTFLLISYEYFLSIFAQVLFLTLQVISGGWSGNRNVV